MNKLLNSQNPLSNQVYDTIQVHSGGALSLLILFLLGAFVLPKGQIPVWWSWGQSDFTSIIRFQCSEKEWIGVAAFLGFTVLFNVPLYLNPLGEPRTIISEEEAKEQSKEQ